MLSYFARLLTLELLLGELLLERLQALVLGGLREARALQLLARSPHLPFDPLDLSAKCIALCAFTQVLLQRYKKENVNW